MTFLMIGLSMVTGRAVHAEPYPLPRHNEEVSTEQLKAIIRHYGLDDIWALIDTQPPELPFKSDGCSIWPDTWFKGKDLYEGCFIHDLFYWSGIPGDRMGRLKADIWLMMWVAENASIELAETMFNGVRVGGGELVNTPWRWGFGRLKENKKKESMNGSGDKHRKEYD